LIFLVRLSLHNALSSIRGMKRAFTEQEEKRIAESIIRQIEASNWSIVLKAMLAAFYKMHNICLPLYLDKNPADFRKRQRIYSLSGAGEDGDGKYDAITEYKDPHSKSTILLGTIDLCRPCRPISKFLLIYIIEKLGISLHCLHSHFYFFKFQPGNIRLCGVFFLYIPRSAMLELK
jgi:hypothetical protein